MLMLQCVYFKVPKSSDSNNNVALFDFSRYVINYSPFDIAYKLCKFPPVRVVIYCAKQIQTVSKVHHGVTYALKKFPGSFVIASLIGIAKGICVYSEYAREFFCNLCLSVYLQNFNNLCFAPILRKCEKSCVAKI